MKPTRLSGGAAAVWDVLAPVATAMGVLTPADVTAFSTLCELQATLEAASAQKPTPGAFKVERDTAATLRPFYDMFGLTPAGRARLHIRPAADPAPRSKWTGALP